MLWDVDHTLIETRGVGGAVFERAFLAATGTPLTNRADMSGRTEYDIMRESLAINGLEPTEERTHLLADALVAGYENARDELRAIGGALPGARDTLAELAAAPGIYQTVLTGNLRAVARIKLEVFGLDSFLELEVGAYGDDQQERTELVAIAQERAAAKTSIAFNRSSTVTVGDTPKDVAAGLAAGVHMIAVASGKSTIADLRAAGAGAVFCDVKDVGRAILALADAAGTRHSREAQ
ncbi:MAG: HAD family hydrolase [Pseudonocardia sp.]